MATKAQSKTVTPRASARLAMGVGLVNFEVGIAPLMSSDRGPRGRILCAEHRQPIKQASYCEAGDHYCESTITGFEANGGFVEVDRNAAAAERSGRIELERLVPLEEIDPLYFEKTYVVWPTDGHATAFDLIAAVLRDGSGGAGWALTGRTVFSRSSRLVVLRWSRLTGGLLRHLCQFDANVRWSDLELVSGAATARGEPDETHLQAAQTLLHALSGEFEPAAEDDYAVALEQAIQAAAAGLPVEARPEAPAAPVIDLMAALTASVEAAKGKAAKPKARKKVAA